MNFKTYNKMDEIDQYELVIIYGVELQKLNRREYYVTLYQLSSFYVEVYITYDCILLNVRCFSEVKWLDIYLENIDITEVIGI